MWDKKERDEWREYILIMKKFFRYHIVNDISHFMTLDSSQ